MAHSLLNKCGSLFSSGSEGSKFFLQALSHITITQHILKVII